MCAQPLSRNWLFEAPWTVSCQAPLSIEFFRQEYWSGLPFPTPGDLPDLGLNPHFLHWQAVSLTLNHLGSPTECYIDNEKQKGWAVWVQFANVSLFPLVMVWPRKDPNSKYEAQFLLNMYHFLTIAMSKNPKLNCYWGRDQVVNKKKCNRPLKNILQEMLIQFLPKFKL